MYPSTHNPQRQQRDSYSTIMSSAIGPSGRRYLPIDYDSTSDEDNDPTTDAHQRQWRMYKKAVCFERLMGPQAQNTRHLRINDSGFNPWLEFVQRVPKDYWIDAFRRNATTITSFSLHTRFVDDRHFRIIGTTRHERRRFYVTVAQGLAELPSLTAIKFAFEDLEGYEALSLFVRRCKSLHRLEIIVKDLPDPPLSDNLGRQFARHRTLQEIAIHFRCNRSSLPPPLILATFPARFPTLQRLQITCEPGIHTDIPIQGLINVPSNLQNLHLQVPIPTSTLYDFLSAEKCPVSTLAIHCRPEEDPNFFPAIPYAIRKLKHLTSLELHLRELSHTFRWCEIVAECPLLRKLRLFTRPGKEQTNHCFNKQGWIGSLLRLQKSRSLRSVFVRATFYHSTIGDTLIGCVTALSGNSPISQLSLAPHQSLHPDKPNRCIISLANANALVTTLRNNYTMSAIPFTIDPSSPDKERKLVEKAVATILALNKKGRRYLLENRTRTKGLNLLVAVKDDLDCLYFHLLENPSLCARTLHPDTPARPGKRRRY